MFRMYLLSVCFLTSVIVQLSWSENALSGNVQRAKHGEFPFVVSISYNNPDKSKTPSENHVCGGSLITRTHVLTSAHCFNQFKGYFHEVVVKTTYNGDLIESVNHKVKKWTTYYDWVQNDVIDKDFYDVAIVELEEGVGYHIKPADVSCISESRLYDKTVNIVGWSFTKNNYSRHLSSGEVVLLPSIDCLRNRQDDLKDRLNKSGAHLYMCTMADPPIYTGWGDSGSPVLRYTNKIIAIHRGSCKFELENGTIAYRENVHLPVKYFMKFLDKVAPCNERKCCVQ